MSGKQLRTTSRLFTHRTDAPQVEARIEVQFQRSWYLGETKARQINDQVVVACCNFTTFSIRCQTSNSSLCFLTNDGFSSADLGC